MINSIPRLPDQPRPRRPRPMIFRMRPGGTAEPEAAAEPRRGYGDRAIAVGLFAGFALVFLLQAPGLDYFVTSRDHGYQLCIGGQVLLDRRPGIDIVTAYGPMAMYTSALGLWASGSLVGETVLCAVGYALCLALLYVLVASNGSRIAGVLAAGVGYLLLARFYKWYVWLIPLATLWGLRGWLDACPGLKQRWLATCGLVVGLSWLYRLDMGTIEFAAIIFLIGAVEIGRTPFRFVRSITTFAAAFAVFPLVWLGYLAVAVGPAAPWAFLQSTLESALSVSRGMASPLPPIVSVVLGYATAIGTLAVGGVVGLYQTRKGSGGVNGRFLLASSLIGAAVFHQAMHRMDPQHLLQVIPAVIVTAFGCLDGLGRGFAASGRTRRRWAFGSLGLAYGGLAVAALWGIGAWARQDLTAFSTQSVARLRELARPLDHGDAYPALRAVEFVRDQTTRADSVLMFPLDSQLLALADRRLSGRLHAYYPGVLDAPEQRIANLEAVEADPPALVVVPTAAPPAPPAWPSDGLARSARESHRYLDDYIRAKYRRVVYNDGQFTILAR